MIYVALDADEQVFESDKANNLRRIRADVAEGCADLRPRARAPREGTAQHISRPTGRHAPPEPSSGSRAAPPPTGSRAPAPQGKPAPGPDSKPIPDDAGDCRPVLTATRTTALSRAGALATAIAAWEAAALTMHGSGFSWDHARDATTECSFQLGWGCTARARLCRP